MNILAPLILVTVVALVAILVRIVFISDANAGTYWLALLAGCVGTTLYIFSITRKGGDK